MLSACGAPQVREPAHRCLILATNDSEANFDGVRRPDGSYVGTIARIAAIKQRELAKNPGGVLLVDAGDILQGRYMERQDGDPVAARARALELYQLAAYDVITLGNHEFDAGAKVLGQALRQAAHTPQVLSSNVDRVQKMPDQSPDWNASPSADGTLPCGGMRLAVVGLLTPAAKTISDFTGVVLHEPATIAALATAQAADMHAPVLVLSHLGVDDDVQLAKTVPNLDVIIGGHSHTVLDKDLVVGKTHIGQTGSRFANLAFWELTQQDGRLDVKYHLEPVDERMPVDGTVQAAVDELRKTLIPEVILGMRKTAWDLVDVAHSAYVRMATRAVLEYAEKTTQQPLDGALLNLGGFRAADHYAPGPVTNIELHAIHPFKNRLVVVALTGAQLLDTLENACTTGHSEQHGRNLATAGVDFTCDASKAAIEYELRDNQPVAIARHGERATVTVHGKPLDLNQTYTIATLDYLAKGGSNYFALTQGNRKCLDGKAFTPADGCQGAILSDVMEAALKNGTLEAPLP